MITILTTTETYLPTVETLNLVERLDELVQVLKPLSAIPGKGDKVLMVDQLGIHSQIDWFDTEPPYLFPTIPFSQEALLAMIFYKLGNEQQAFHFLNESDDLYQHLMLATRLRFGYEISDDKGIQLNAHNKAIIAHYGNMEVKKTLNELRRLYADSLENAANNEIRSYSAKHYLNLLLDARLFEDAVLASEAFLKEVESESGKMAIKMQWSNAKFKNLNIPYDAQDLQEILQTQEDCINYLRENEMHLNAAILAMDASDTASYSGDYPSAKKYINLAIQTFKEEDIPDFLGEAGLKKAHLLYKWSKNGSPQYYKASINAFQDVLKIFKKESHPDYFAEIQHSLALIYSEIPAPPEEKPMWTAFSASSFKEALDYFTKENHPYEYAMVCHNYATALMEFPPAKLHNNFERANDLFEEALKIRSADKYPTERALSLLNQLELGWLMNNSDANAEVERWELMKSKAIEAIALSQDENLLHRAQQQLDKLEELRTIM